MFVLRIRGFLWLSCSKIAAFVYVRRKGDYPDLTRYTMLHCIGLQMGQAYKRRDALWPRSYVRLLHLKIDRAERNQLTNSTDNTIYGLTNLPTPVCLLTVDAALKMATAHQQCASEQQPFSTIHTYTGKNLNALITETLDAYLRL